MKFIQTHYSSSYHKSGSKKLRDISLVEISKIKEATNADLEWAEAITFGTLMRYGLPSAQLKTFIDQTDAFWQALTNKIGSSFTTAATAHGGQEATIPSLNTIFYHWNMIIVAPSYVELSQFVAGIPYGASFTSNNAQLEPDEIALTAAVCKAIVKQKLWRSLLMQNDVVEKFRNSDFSQKQTDEIDSAVF